MVYQFILLTEVNYKTEANQFKQGGILIISIGHLSWSYSHFFRQLTWYLWLQGVFIIVPFFTPSFIVCTF